MRFWCGLKWLRRRCSILWNLSLEPLKFGSCLLSIRVCVASLWRTCGKLLIAVTTWSMGELLDISGLYSSYSRRKGRFCLFGCLISDSVHHATIRNVQSRESCHHNKRVATWPRKPLNWSTSLFVTSRRVLMEFQHMATGFLQLSHQGVSGGSDLTFHFFRRNGGAQASSSTVNIPCLIPNQTVGFIAGWTSVCFFNVWTTHFQRLQSCVVVNIWIALIWIHWQLVYFKNEN